MVTSLKFKGDPQRINWSDNDTDICCYCDNPIPEECVPLIIFSETLMAKFCDKCSETLFGIESFEEPKEQH